MYQWNLVIDLGRSVLLDFEDPLMFGGTTGGNTNHLNTSQYVKCKQTNCPIHPVKNMLSLWQ